MSLGIVQVCDLRARTSRDVDEGGHWSEGQETRAGGKYPDLAAPDPVPTALKLNRKAGESPEAKRSWQNSLDTNMA